MNPTPKTTNTEEKRCAMSRDDYRTRKAKAKALRLRRAKGTRAKETQRTIAAAIGCY